MKGVHRGSCSSVMTWTASLCACVLRKGSDPFAVAVQTSAEELVVADMRV